MRTHKMLKMSFIYLVVWEKVVNGLRIIIEVANKSLKDLGSTNLHLDGKNLLFAKISGQIFLVVPRFLKMQISTLFFKRSHSVQLFIAIHLTSNNRLFFAQNVINTNKKIVRF